MEISSTTFWDAIDILRKEATLSKAELSRRARVNVSFFSAKRRRGKVIHFPTIARITKVLQEEGINVKQFALLVDTLAQMEN